MKRYNLACSFDINNKTSKFFIPFVVSVVSVVFYCSSIVLAFTLFWRYKVVDKNEKLIQNGKPVCIFWYS